MESDSHSFLKEKIADDYKDKGYEVELEYHLENGLIVDVAAQNDQETVFIEIGAMHGENRSEKLDDYCDRLVHLPQIDKPKNRSDDYTTVSFRKEFLDELEQYIEDSPYFSIRFFLKHLALKEMRDEEGYSEQEIKEIGKKLEKLGYMDR